MNLPDDLHPACDRANPGSRQRAASAALLASALGLLALGTLVYVLDRPSGSAALLPRAWQLGAAGAWFGPLGLWLPSFVHAFAFSVLTAWVLPPARAGLWLACGGWAMLETLFEFGQHRAVSPWLASALGQAFGDAGWATHLARYFTRGVFDPADLAAAWAGCALAALALYRARAPAIAKSVEAPATSRRIS